MEKLHALLLRQWRRIFGREAVVPDGWHAFLQTISETYKDFDAARILVERALALSSDELHAANAELRGVLHVLPDLLFRVGSDDRIRDVAQGTSGLDYPAMRAFREPPSADGPMALGRFWDAVKQVRDTQSSIAFEWSDDAPNQASLFEVRLLPFVESDIIGIVRDITLRKQAETALRESEERSVLAQRAGHVGVFDWNLPAERIFWSAESEEIFGLLRGTFAGSYQGWLEAVVPEDRACLDGVIQAWLRSHREDDSWEYRVLHPDRTERWVETKGHVFRNTTGKPERMIGTHLDVTVRKQAEKDRLVLGKLESTGILAGGIAHDFNNLLAGILMSLETIESNQSSPEDLILALLDAKHAVSAARALTQQLITFARGGAAIRQTTDLGRLLHESAPWP